ncbi:hypothetical protein [Kribbella sp. NBC_00359]|uniref:hypothetical protein n=1 Tax=Kribbella sp. NBC_00359 TaxID=2975966 RepID=UPI002E1E2601
MSAIATTIDRDVKQHSDTVTTGGFETLAETLHPALQWRPPVLHVDMRHIDRDLDLRGRGIRLVPSFFCWRHPIMPADPEVPPVLVYPVHHDPAWSARAEPCADQERAVADLLGRTRAAVLRSISAGACSTSELAARAGISLASASEHARPAPHRPGHDPPRRQRRAPHHQPDRDPHPHRIPRLTRQ